MRLWHYKLLPYLPKSQLVAQWRELNSIFKKQDNHILINYVYEYPKDDLWRYTYLLLREFEKRGINVRNYNNMENYFTEGKNWYPLCGCFNPFPNHHNNRYLLQCFYNLQEKYDRGQKDFSKEQYEELEKFIKEEEKLI